MSAYSQNGYTANDRSVIASYTVPGTTLRIALRKGDVSVVLLEYLRRYHLEVESLDNVPQDLWGYAERTIRGSSTELSNHASGTAADCHASAHPLGVAGTMTPAAKLAAVRRLVDSFEGVLRWGGDYGTPARGGVAGSRVDEMHIEINAGPADVARLASKIRTGTVAAAAPNATAAPATLPKDDVVIDNIPVSGKGTLRLICPVGRASRYTGSAFISAVTNGPSPATVQAWFQSDGAGISDFTWTIGFHDGRSDRPYAEFPDGATQINLHYDFPDGGVLCLEAGPK